MINGITNVNSIGNQKPYDLPWFIIPWSWAILIVGNRGSKLGDFLEEKSLHSSWKGNLKKYSGNIY
jgi:hypothetical protein